MVASSLMEVSRCGVAVAAGLGTVELQEEDELDELEELEEWEEVHGLSCTFSVSSSSVISTSACVGGTLVDGVLGLLTG